MKKNKKVMCCSLFVAFILQLAVFPIVFNKKINPAEAASCTLYDKTFGSGDKTIGNVSCNKGASVECTYSSDSYQWHIYTTNIAPIPTYTVSGFKFCGYVEEGYDVLVFDENGNSNFVGPIDDADDKVYHYHSLSIYLVAKWESTGPSASTITFDPNGGSGGPSKIASIKNGDTMPTISDKPTLTNNIFLGYFDDANKKYYDSDLVAVVSTWDKSDGVDYTLYAHWDSTAIAFANKFIADNDTGIGGLLKPYITNTTALKSRWSALSTDYGSNVSADGKLILKNAENYSDSSLITFASMYNCVYGKYGTTCSLNNFAQRSVSAKSVNPPLITNIGDVTNGNNTPIIITLVAIICSTITITGYFFLKKRKED